jgi:hypothetical protein
MKTRDFPRKEFNAVLFRKLNYILSLQALLKWLLENSWNGQIFREFFN